MWYLTLGCSLATFSLSCQMIIRHYCLLHIDYCRPTHLLSMIITRMSFFTTDLPRYSSARVLGALTGALRVVVLWVRFPSTRSFVRLTLMVTCLCYRMTVICFCSCVLRNHVTRLSPDLRINPVSHFLDLIVSSSLRVHAFECHVDS